jgi:O-6-methylguanine DNA methyltransferase
MSQRLPGSTWYFAHVADVVHTAEFETPEGRMMCASTDRGLCFIQLPRASGRGFAGWLRRFAPTAQVRAGFAPNRSAIAQLQEYLAGKRQTFRIDLDLRATSFQIQVYAALLAIPYGETRSYGEIARAIGEPGASRAVGAANGANPLPLVVPCHRVIAARGKLGGFGGGLALKKRLLALEHGRHPQQGELL